MESFLSKLKSATRTLLLSLGSSLALTAPESIASGRPSGRGSATR